MKEHIRTHKDQPNSKYMLTNCIRKVESGKTGLTSYILHTNRHAVLIPLTRQFKLAVL